MREWAQDERFFRALLHTTERYLNQLGIGKLSPLGPEDSRFEDVTCSVEVSGAIRGSFVFSVERKLALTFAIKYLIDEVTEVEATQYAEDVVAEISNVITGNALSEWEEHPIILGHPHPLAEECRVASLFTDAFVQPYMTEYGKFDCIYVPAAFPDGKGCRTAG